MFSRRRHLIGWTVVGGLAMASCSQLTNLPKLKPADLRFHLAESSKIFAADGELVTTLHGEENRTVIHDLAEIPKYVRRAVVAIEDERFFEHEGVDFKAIIRAAVANLSSGQIQEGGSTITQQYIKNVIIAPGEIAAKTIQRKIDEAALARQLESKLSKREILLRYLNTVYFGNGAYGLQAAAKTYFGEQASRLTLAQGAVLAALIRSPETYDPFDQPKEAKARRNLVLAKMVEKGWLPARRAQQLQDKRLKVTRGEAKVRYPAPYFVDYVQRLITYDPRFESLASDWRKRQQLLYTGGLRIYTTVDLEEQKAAEQAVHSVLTERGDPYASLVSIDPKSGHVKAMVGGRDYFATKKEDRFAKLNLAIQGEPGLGRVGDCGAEKVEARAPGCGRQAGSSFKTFALAGAIEKGKSLSESYKAPACMSFPGADNGKLWRPCNYEEAPYGEMSLLDATVFSVNVVYAQLAQQIGVDTVVDTADQMGIETPLAPVASAVLGTNGVNPLDMASAYGTLATVGVHHPPVAITRITNAEGKVLYRDSSKPKDVLSSAAAYITTSALTQVLQRGTGAAYGQIGRPAAGKTGTAQDYHDAWFVGYTPDRVASVWIGYPEGPIAMTPTCDQTRNEFGEEICRPTRIQVSGGTWPTLIWANFMQRALADVPASSFPTPGNLITVEIDTRTGCLANKFTPAENRATAPFAPGEAPTKTCFIESDATRVPDVVNFSRKEAVKALERNGLAIVVEEEPSARPPGTVLAQSPAGGTRIAAGGTVTITIAIPPVKQVEVPSVLGLKRDQAVEALRNAGLNASVVTQTESNKKDAKRHKGRVWKQDPASGTKVDKGRVVVIFVNPG
jgi:membrane peptidoglycan carboxypeptidase